MAPPTIDLGSLTGGFDFQPRTRLVFGAGALQYLGTLAAGLGGRHALIVTDPGIRSTGHVDRACASLAAAGLGVTVFDQVEANPTTTCVDRCLAVAQAAGIDLFVGLGGGSSLDTAKGCNFLLTNGGRMQDYWGYGKAARPLLPLIAIPTTAGTGSECQSYALISQAETHVKMACGDPKAAPAIALLDPELTRSQPLAVAASTGIDALAHALESAVCRRATPLSRVFSREAARLVLQNLAEALRNPDHTVARANLLLGAAYGGLAIENSMLGAAHAAANPLTARFGVVHGHAVGLMLVPVMRLNATLAEARAEYETISHTAGLDGTVTALLKKVTDLRALAGLPAGLAAAGVDLGQIPQLAAEAASQWTGQFNPVPVTAPEFVALYQDASHH
jgi:alcohol dehydrogenase